MDNVTVEFALKCMKFFYIVNLKTGKRTGFIPVLFV